MIYQLFILQKENYIKNWDEEEKNGFEIELK